MNTAFPKAEHASADVAAAVPGDRAGGTRGRCPTKTDPSEPGPTCLPRCAVTSEVDRSDVPFTAGYKEPQAGLCRSQKGYLVLGPL